MAPKHHGNVTMTVELSVLVGLVVLMSGIIYRYSGLNSKVDQNAIDHVNLIKSTDAQHNLLHDKIRENATKIQKNADESTDRRERFQKDLGQIREMIIAKDSKLDTLAAAISRLEASIEKIKDYVERKDHD